MLGKGEITNFYSSYFFHWVNISMNTKNQLLSVESVLFSKPLEVYTMMVFIMYYPVDNTHNKNGQNTKKSDGNQAGKRKEKKETKPEYSRRMEEKAGRKAENEV